MRRILLLLALLAGASAAHAEGVALRGDVTIDSDEVRLGDLFVLSGGLAQTPIARAPQPGQRVWLEAAWLAEVARRNGVDWQPSGRGDRVALTRAGTRIEREEIEAALLRALRAKGLGDSLEVDLGRRLIEFTVPGHAKPGLAVRDLALDSRTGRFTALVVAPANGPESARLSLSGQVFRMVELPVPARALMPGDVISAEDIASQRIRANLVRADAVLDADAILGATPRRPLQPGEIVRKSDLKTPVMVAKGALVTIRYDTAQMRLTAQGKALANGTEGETIAVLNTRSNVTLDARILGPNLVAVIAPSALARTTE